MQHQIKAENETFLDVFERGYHHATKSMALMTGLTLKHRVVKCQLFNPETEGPKFNKEGKLAIVTTDLMGELNGRSHFILNEKDWSSITRHRTTQKLSKQMEEEFVKEMDNIISAAMVARISTFLSMKIYGDIPRLEHTTEPLALDTYFKSALSRYKTGFYSIAEISIAEYPETKALFIWLLGNKFSEQVAAHGLLVPSKGDES